MLMIEHKEKMLSIAQTHPYSKLSYHFTDESIKPCFLKKAIEIGGYANCFFSALGQKIRNNMFPLFNKHHSEYSKLSHSYASEFVEVLKGQTSYLDPTFPYLEDIVRTFEIKDMSIEIKVKDIVYNFNIRLIESKKPTEDDAFRIILFSFYENTMNIGREDLVDSIEWNPTSIDEIGGVVLDILNVLQQKGIRVDSLMTFSIGGVVLDSLKYISVENQNVVPNTIIINRSIASVRKATNQYWYSRLLFVLIKYFRMNADPECELLQFFNRTKDYCLKKRQIVLLEAKHDHYFSDGRGFDFDYHEKLSKAGVDVHRINCFIPMFHTAAHHAIRMDFMLTNNQGSDSTYFFNVKKGENIPMSLMKHVFSEPHHTLFIVGGNLQTLDMMTYQHAAPLLSAYVKQK